LEAELAEVHHQLEEAKQTVSDIIMCSNPGPCYVYGQLASLLPVKIVKMFSFNLLSVFLLFNVSPISSFVLNTLTPKQSDLFIYFIYF